MKKKRISFYEWNKDYKELKGELLHINPNLAVRLLNIVNEAILYGLDSINLKEVIKNGKQTGKT